MQDKTVSRQTSVVIYILMSFLTIFGFVFILNILSSIIWPALGFAFAFILRYERKVIIPVGFGILSGYFIYNVYDPSHSLLGDLVYSFIFTVNGIFIITISVMVFEKIRHSVFMSLYNLFALLLLFTLMALYLALSANLVLYLLGVVSGAEILDSLIIWFLGDLFGLVIFGLTVSASLHYDDTSISFLIKNKVGRHEIIFYIILALFSYLFFSEIFPSIGYDGYKFLFLPFAIYGAYHFQHRAYFIGALIFLLAIALWPPYDLSVVSKWYMLFDINLFLTFIAVLYFSLQILFKNLERERQTLDENNIRLNRLLDSMDGLFRLSEDMIVTNELDTKKQASKTFRIIFDLFSDIDYGACMFIKDNKITWIDAIGYDITLLNELRSDAHIFKGELDKPLKIENSESWLKKDFGDSYQAHTAVHPKVKETVLMSVNISADYICEMSFDIDISSSYSFGKDVMQYFESINVLLNGFYESQLLSEDYDDKQTAMVMSLLDIIELFDTSTSQHSLDVAALCKLIGKSFDIKASMINRLYWAGIMHDIGKIGISKAIVNKPGTLSVHEYDIMKKHTEYGFDLVNHSNVLRPIADLIYSHHERYDGTGYPKGLNDESLTLENYVLNISEVIASMSRDTQYRPRRSKMDIVETLRHEANKAWPDYVVSKVLVLMDEGLLDMFDTTETTPMKNA